MKIFNYSDKPVLINGIEVSDHIVHLDNSIQRHFVKHDGRTFLTPHTTGERNMIYTILNNSSNTGYEYRNDSVGVPDVFFWVSIFFTFFGFWFVMKITQKIKTR